MIMKDWFVVVNLTWNMEFRMNWPRYFLGSSMSSASQETICENPGAMKLSRT
jgi:hypothetical protein